MRYMLTKGSTAPYRRAPVKHPASVSTAWGGREGMRLRVNEP